MNKSTETMRNNFRYFYFAWFGSAAGKCGFVKDGMCTFAQRAEWIESRLNVSSSSNKNNESTGRAREKKTACYELLLTTSWFVKRKLISWIGAYIVFGVNTSGKEWMIYPCHMRCSSNSHRPQFTVAVMMKTCLWCSLNVKRPLFHITLTTDPSSNRWFVKMAFSLSHIYSLALVIVYAMLLVYCQGIRFQAGFHLSANANYPGRFWWPLAVCAQKTITMQKCVLKLQLWGSRDR